MSKTGFLGCQNPVSCLVQAQTIGTQAHNRHPGTQSAPRHTQDGKMAHRTANGSQDGKWLKMAEMAKISSKWLKMAKISSKWLKLAQNGISGHKMAYPGTGWHMYGYPGTGWRMYGYPGTGCTPGHWMYTPGHWMYTPGTGCSLVEVPGHWM